MPEEIDISPSPSPSLIDADARHSWHPFTQMQEYLDLPRLQIVRGEGCWLYDAQGQRYLDGNASIWTNVHGHNHPELNQAIQEQAGQLAHCTHLGLHHPSADALSAQLSQLTQDQLPRVLFSDNGSQAIEIALKLSFQYWQLQHQPQKTETIHVADAYHGDTFGTMSVSGSDRFHGRFHKWRSPSHRLPHPYISESQTLHSLEQLLEERGHHIASFIVEPFLQGAAGMQAIELSFLQAAATLCRKHQVHIIYDEVFVGFGRLGSIIPSQEHPLPADFICLAKGLAAGYLPLAATLTRSEIYQSFLGTFSQDKAFFHGHTFSANPLACAVALKNIELLQKLIASGSLQQNIAYFQQAIEQHLSPLPQVRSTRSTGLAAAIDLCPPHQPEHSFDTDQRIGMHTCMRARQHGLILRPLGDSLLLVPPIAIAQSEIDHLIQSTQQAIQDTLPHNKQPQNPKTS